MNNNREQILELTKQLLQYMREHPEEVQELVQLKKAQGTKTKFDRCVEHVSKQPGITNPYAVCVSAGVRPSRWKKSELGGSPKSCPTSKSCPMSKEGQQEMSSFRDKIKIELEKPFTPRFYKPSESTQKTYTCKAQSDPYIKPIMALRRIKPSDIRVRNSVMGISRRALGYKQSKPKKESKNFKKQ